ncbi:MAG: hypothetical protein ABJC19_02360 [Gemmatimonadota bacterium]
MRHVSSLPLAGSLLLLAACGSSPTGPVTVEPLCSTPMAVTLNPGDSRVLNASSETACIRLPGAASASEYLVVAYSGNGTESNNGVSASYALQGDPAVATASAVAGFGSLSELPGTAPFVRGSAAEFHLRLRAAEHALATSGSAQLQHLWSGPPAARVIPVFGDRDSFSVCKVIVCNSFTRVGATVRYVGRAGVIYLDDATTAGAEQLTQADLDQLGGVFDDYLYPADTTAFGRESDINGDQRVAILITKAVNDLTPDCTNGRVIGYFFGNDLLVGAVGSNRREVFYAFAPKPATASCSAVTRSRELTSLPPTLIHEFQHMISYNQHVLIRGSSDEDLWLNEGLSHFAEELGFRVTPDAACPAATSCFSQFASGDLSDAYDYLNDPEATFLIAPRSGTGSLAERGAAWLFVRWAADHFASDTLLGTSLTRALVQTTQVGSESVASAAGIPFSTLVGEWQMANYTDNLPGFPQVGRLRYRTWDFRGVFGRNSPAVFAKPYPLTPDSTSGSYSRSGTLRGGSGRHVRFKLPAGSPGVTVRLAGSTAGTRVNDAILPRIAVVRIQ